MLQWVLFQSAAKAVEVDEGGWKGTREENPIQSLLAPALALAGHRDLGWVNLRRPGTG